MCKNKRFSKKLSDKWDPFGKKVASEFLESVFGLQLIAPLEEQEEKYKEFDFVMKFDLEGNPTDDLNVRKIETEVKVRGWNAKGRWQGWPSLDVPYRKKDSQADTFVMVNRHGDTVAIAAMDKVIDKKYYKEKTTVYSKGKPEPFFAVPLENFDFFYKRGASWVQIKPTGEVYGEY